MYIITQISPKFHTLLFHYWGTKQVFIDSLSDEIVSYLWHHCLIHCVEHILKDAHKHIEGVPDTSKLSVNDLTICAIYLIAKLIKNSAVHKSLCDSLTLPYQGLYIDF